MKQIWKYMIVALAGLSMFACTPKENFEETPGADKYIYTIAVADTKAYFDSDHMTWESGDIIGWFTDKAGNSEINMSASPRTFTVSSDAAMSSGALIYAYAPYKAGDQSKTAAPLSIPAVQNGTITNAMPMVSLPIELTSGMSASTDTPVGQASFINLGSVIEYNIYTSNASYGTEKIESVKFSSSSSIAGSFTVDLTAVAENSIPAISGLSGTSVTSTLASPEIVGGSKAAGIKVYQVVAPGTYSGTITVLTDAATYEYSITNKEFKRGSIKPLNVDLASVNATRGSRIEYLLTASQWELKDVKEAGVSITSTTGNKLTLMANHTMSFDCSANGGETFDHTWTGGMIAPNAYGEVSDMAWSVSSNGGKDFINVTNGFLLVFAQESMSGIYEIKELTDSKLTVDIETYGETWTLLFEAVDNSPAGPTPTPTLACPYWHDFANGDWGIGPAFDWGGWNDGYYYSMLTTPATLDAASWSISEAGYYEWAGTQAESGWRHGIQIGTGGMTVSSLKLTSSSFPGEITKVTLGYNSGIVDNSSLTVSCKVGGSAFGSTVAHGDGDYEAVFTGNASGEIEISLASTVNGAIYLYYVAVEYDPDGSSPI